MKPNYKVVYVAKNGEKVESLFHSLDLAQEFAVMMNAIVFHNNEPSTDFIH